MPATSRNGERLRRRSRIGRPGSPSKSSTVQPPAPYAHVELPYSACEPMADLRNNLTGTPYPSAKSDAVLHSLGVRCIGEPYPTVVRAHY